MQCCIDMYPKKKNILLLLCPRIGIHTNVGKRATKNPVTYRLVKKNLCKHNILAQKLSSVAINMTILSL
jgi:hypothetical protein